MRTWTRKWVLARINVYTIFLSLSFFLSCVLRRSLFFVFPFDSVSILLAYSQGSGYFLETPVSYICGLS
ncbi:hypothetical protein F4813DRAFT_349716, partial [Daldinia decipiens]|uniref:uncharacterized protein n=1 Tax=Daldinia decipiens TaxID=326647 RepID=UPI0020C3BDB1